MSDIIKCSECDKEFLSWSPVSAGCEKCEVKLCSLECSNKHLCGQVEEETSAYEFPIDVNHVRVSDLSPQAKERKKFELTQQFMEESPLKNSNAKYSVCESLAICTLMNREYFERFTEGKASKEDIRILNSTTSKTKSIARDLGIGVLMNPNKHESSVKDDTGGESW